jgi:DNA replication protein DnaC
VKKLYATIGSLGIRVPAHVEELCKPVNHYRACHGHDFNEGPWSCPSCDTAHTLTRMAEILGDPRCGACGFFMSRRCSADGCDTLVAGFGEPDYWCPPWPFCPSCLDEEVLRERTACLVRIPQRVRHAAVKGWEGRYEHRKKAGVELAKWLECKLGYDGGPSALYIWGNVGSGKTTVAARAAVKAVTAGHVSDVQWVREGAFISAAKSQYSNEQSAELLDSMRHSALLVYDEMWTAADSYTDHVRSTMADIFSLRFEERRPTIMTSNEPPLFVQVLDTRVDSRFNGASRIVEVRGPDLRSGGDTNNNRR